MHLRSGSSLRPPDAPHPAPPISSPRISNRHWKGLEIAVNSTKHSPDLISNRQKNKYSWGRYSCLRNAAHTSMICARTSAPRRVAQAGVGRCAVVSRAFDKHPSSSLPSCKAKRDPFTGRRLSLRLLSVSPRPLTSPPVATQLIISNRSARRLELPETYTKQRTDPLSNRHKFTHCNTTSLPTSPKFNSRRPKLSHHEPKSAQRSFAPLRITRPSRIKSRDTKAASRKRFRKSFFLPERWLTRRGRGWSYVGRNWAPAPLERW
jgi:hypothetical protein